MHQLPENVGQAPVETIPLGGNSLSHADEDLPPPQSRRILGLHLAGVMLQGAAVALTYILPFLARKHFQANNWQTWVLTAAVPIMQFFTIFWNQLYARVSTRTYLAIIAALACVPVALMALVQDIEPLLACYVLAAFAGAGGGAALSPINADLLRTCYAAGVRGRVFGIVVASQYFGVMIAGQAMGSWSNIDANAFRIFLPITAILLATGLLMFGLISRTQTFHHRARLQISRGEPWWAPLRDMGKILRADRRFAGYEIAFMSYGVGWMICTALIPALAKDKLDLDYSQFSRSTIVAFQLTMIFMLIPMGRLADRVGSVRLAGGSFLWLAIYPIGLLIVPSSFWLGAVTMLFAMGMVGVHLTWTLGPVTFAPDPSRAPHYLAIHGTLVGIRGILAQGIGVALYATTGSFVPPMILAAAGFIWASWRMRRLAKETD